MLGIFGVLTLILFCGGLVLVGVMGSGSESKGVQAAQLVTGPAMFAITGLLTSLITHFAIKENVLLKVLIPLVAAIVAGPCALGCLAVFFTAIWPSL